MKDMDGMDRNRHATTCPANMTRLLADCTCGMAGAERARARRVAREKHRIIMNEAAAALGIPGAVEALDAIPEKPSGHRTPALPDPLIRMRELWMSVRRAAGKTEEEIAAAATTGTEGSISIGTSDVEVLDWVGNGISEMSGRLVSITRASMFEMLNRQERPTVRVSQVCPACREQHHGDVTEPDTDDLLKLVADLGSQARRLRFLHRCPAISMAAIQHLTFEDIQKVATDLERDGTEMVSRSEKLRILADQRAIEEKSKATAGRDEQHQQLEPKLETT